MQILSSNWPCIYASNSENKSSTYEIDAASILVMFNKLLAYLVVTVTATIVTAVIVLPSAVW